MGEPSHQRHPRPKFTFGTKIPDNNNKAGPASKGEEDPLTKTRQAVGTSPAVHKENTIQAGRPFGDVGDRNQRGEHRLLQHIRGQNSTVSPPRPQKMKLHMHGGADTSTGARAKEIKGQHQNTPSVSTHTHRRKPATENCQEATGVVIFRPKMEPDPTDRITNENDGTTITPNKYLTTRKGCKGTVYRLAQVGRSGSIF